MKTATDSLPRDYIATRVAEAKEKWDGQNSNSFQAKIRLASQVKCKCEVFNVWHAAADNVTEKGVDIAWGASVVCRTAA